ncbi:GNAT family protein [Streptosporangium sp. NPDC051022]|uniref:GNAT family N-acetyltransferase n=1 Tax=Streptosporangium sp. NPDC051022 TaxID=3155752 RepID=UPI003428ABC9
MRNWPLFDLSVTSPRLELRSPSLTELDELADVAARGVHDEGDMPFIVPWSAAEPSQRARSTVRECFRSWAEFTPSRWTLSFAVIHEGQVIGLQALKAVDFPVTREVKTSTWLGRGFQGRGLGTELRAVVHHLAFAGLRAEHMTTVAFADNHASIAVYGKFDYLQDGINVVDRQGEAAVGRRFRLPRARWAPRDDIKIHNLERCLPLFGL